MFTIQEVSFDKNKICETILRALPEWFGIESAIIDYIKAVQKMPMLVAKSNTEIIGFLSLQTHFSETAEIHVMGILSLYHRQGVGRLLIQAAQNYLIEKNFMGRAQSLFIFDKILTKESSSFFASYV